MIFLSFLPELNIPGLKKFDILSDLFQMEETLDMSNLLADASSGGITDDTGHISDSLLPLPKNAPVYSGAPIEDFSTELNGLANLSRAIKLSEHKKRPVRIAFLGDSFTEGDILTCHLRDSLQNVFGGSGIGFVPVVTPVKHRINSISDYRNRKVRSIVRPSGSDASKFIINGQYFIPETNAWFSIRATGPFKNSGSWNYTDILFTSSDTVLMDIRINSEKNITHIIPPNEHVQLSSVKYTGSSSVEASLKNIGTTTIYGFYLNDHSGIYVDNFSLRSSSGPNLSLINYNSLAEISELMKYDLIILQYGLNVAEPDRKAYSLYKEKMADIIEKLKHSMPETDIMIMSVSDRSFRGSSGELRTMPGVKSMVSEQRAIAEKTGITFWNTFDAMGGEGSMIEFVKKKLANSDYTHINYSGGKILGEKLATSLIEAIEQYYPGYD